MNWIIPIISVLFYYKVSVKYFLIFQQQYYSPYRFVNVIIEKKEFTLSSILIFLTMIIFAILPSFKLSFLIYSLIILILTFAFKSKKIIGLKYTKRIIRMYIFLSAFLLSIFLFLYSFLPNYFYIAIPLIYTAFPIFVLFSNVVLMPIEKLINCKFIKQAKTKLKQVNPIIIAITGSFGKTSTKHFLNTILSSYYTCLATPASYNTVLGIVKTINTNLKKEHKIFIIEVGVDEVNGMNKFLKLFSPNYVIVTGIGAQHLKTFKSVENILNEKMKLAHSVVEDGLVLLNGDNEYLRRYPIIRNTIYYGTKNDNNCILKILKQENGVTNFSIDNKEFETSLLGDHFILNLSSTIYLSLALKVPYKFVYNAVKKLKNYDHRLKLIQKEKYLVIDDSYNSNLEGFMNALDVLNSFTKFRILITPGIIELGDQSYDTNLKVAQYSIDKIDFAIIIGNLKPFKDVYDKNKIKYKQVSSYNDAIKMAESMIYKDIVVLVENDLPDNYLI